MKKIIGIVIFSFSMATLVAMMYAPGSFFLS